MVLERDEGVDVAWRSALHRGDHVDVALPRPLGVEHGRVGGVVGMAVVVPEDVELGAVVLLADLHALTEYYGTELDVLGYYHSHPDHPAYPSVFDTQRSWQGYVYVIASVQGGTPRDVNAFVALKDHGPMVREQLEIV